MESDCSVLGIHILAFRSWFVSETLSSMDVLTASSTPVSRLRFMNLFSVGIIALMYPTWTFLALFYASNIILSRSVSIKVSVSAIVPAIYCIVTLPTTNMTVF